MRIFIWALVLLIFAAVFLLVWRHKDNAAAASPGGRHGAFGGPVVLTTATAQRGDIGVYLDAIGTVTPVYTAAITSQVNGIINAVNYREGQTVRKGDSLIEVDPRPYQASLAEAEGTLEHDEAVLAQAKMDLDRYRDAWSHNAIPKQTLDDQEKVVLQDEGTVKLDKATVQYDQVQLGFCHITSPITGKVGLRLIDPGNVVQSSSSNSLAVVTQVDPITVIFTIPEDNLGQVTPHMRKGQLEVTAFDRTGQAQIARGVLLTVDNQIDTTTGTVKARAQFANKEGALYPNQFVNTRLLTNTIHNATLIPTSAIQHNGTAAYVYVIQDNVAHMRSVKTGVVDGDTTQVTGIEPEDVVANSSFDKLQDNSKVEISKKPLPVSTDTGSSAP